LRFDIHYSNRLGEPVKDQTSIGLVFAKEPVKQEVALLDIENELFLIPPNAPNHQVTSCYTLPKPVIALALTAHMHFRGKSMMTEALYPDGRREMLFNVPHYDFRWQRTYSLRRPKLLPKGTKLIITAQFDNSANNPLNPDPSKTIRWGEPSGDEMMAFWMQFSDPNPIETKSAVAETKH